MGFIYVVYIWRERIEISGHIFEHQKCASVDRCKQTTALAFAGDQFGRIDRASGGGIQLEAHSYRCPSGHMSQPKSTGRLPDDVRRSDCEPEPSNVFTDRIDEGICWSSRWPTRETTFSRKSFGMCVCRDSKVAKSCSRSSPCQVIRLGSRLCLAISSRKALAAFWQLLPSRYLKMRKKSSLLNVAFSIAAERCCGPVRSSRHTTRRNRVSVDSV